MRPTLKLLKDRAWSDGSILVPFGLLLAFTPDDAPADFWRKGGATSTTRTTVSAPCCSAEHCALTGCTRGCHLPPPAA